MMSIKLMQWLYLISPAVMDSASVKDVLLNGRCSLPMCVKYGLHEVLVDLRTYYNLPY